MIKQIAPLGYAGLSAALLAGLFIVSRYNFLLFHSLAELFSIAVAWSVFLLVWNARRVARNDALVYLGVAYFFIGLIDLIHTLAYKGTGVFPAELAANFATQLWIGGRSLEAASLLLFPLLLGRRLPIGLMAAGYAVISAIILASIFAWGIFPVCFIEGVGLTTFKKTAEYVICLTLMGAVFLLARRRTELDADIFKLMVGAMAATIAAEICFTFYISVYGVSNVIGHFFKVLSFVLVYAALIRSAFTRPYTTLFKELEKEKQALYQSEQTKNAIISCSPVALYTVGLDGNVLTWNISAERIFGWKEAEVVGKPLPIVPNDKRGEYDALRRQGLEDGGFSGKELMRLKSDGTLFPVSLSAAPVRNDRGELIGLLAVAEDITERKRDQMRVEHLNQMLRAIRDINQLIVRERSRDRLIREGCRLLVANRGYLSALIVLTDKQGRSEVWAMEGLAAESEALASMLEQGALPPCCGYALVKQEVLPVEDRDRVCSGCPIAETFAKNQSLCMPLTHEGETFGYLAAAAEEHLVVEEEERTLFGEMASDFAYALSVMRIEAAHKESEARFRSIVENAPEPIFIQAEMRFAYLNPKALELFGATDAQELLGTPVMERFHPDYHEIIRQRIKLLNEDRKSVKDFLELEFLRLDGTPVWVETTGQPIVYQGKNGALVFVREITVRKRHEQEREKLQSQLIQSQKLESVGRLAGGVAHDYNNMLSVIIGYTELAMDKTRADDPLREDLDEVLNAARRSTDITRQLLAFARRQTIDPKVLELNDTVEEMLKMLRRLIGEDIDLSWKSGPGRMPVFMDPSQLDQLLANLLVNARDAIGGVGKVTIETDHVSFDAEYCADHAGFVPGDFVMLAVSDDGCGMEKETLDHLFEPFFTTKGVGEGTGLGLATVFGIVKQNEGFINVYSEPGKGTTFRIYLPLHGGQTAGIQAKEPTDLPAARGETVLVVEDEPPVLKLAQKILENLGYAVLAAPTPGIALDLVSAYAGNIHLLITDVVMPEMNGRELSESLRAHYPDLKVLFMSGYTANVIAHRGVLDEGVHFIQKPFSTRDLALKVREALIKQY